MKKIPFKFVLLISIICIQFTYSQEKYNRFGIFGGGNYTFLTSDDFETSPGLGYELGINYQLYLNNKSNLISEFSYSENFFKIHVTGYDNNLTAHNFENDFNVENLFLGVYYNYYLFLDDDDNNLSVIGGGKVSVSSEWIDATNPYEYGNVSFGSQNMPVSSVDLLESIDLYGSIGISGGTNRIIGKLMYSHTLTDPMRNLTTENDDPMEAKTSFNMISLNICYLF